MEYKDRLIIEYNELKNRYDKLHKMIIKYEAGTLNFTPSCSKELLEDQAYYMGNYLRILEVRAQIEDINIWEE